MSKIAICSLALVSTLSLSLLSSFSAHATIVEFKTSHGDFKINLHDQTTPKTVDNFLKYVLDEDYHNTVIHRIAPDFIMQAGGFSFEGDFPLTALPIDPVVKNEPIYSNVRGTIAMAKNSDLPHSATSQWFINYKNNSGNLDFQNGGFTVFGEVIEGMDNIDAIADIFLCNSVPMPDYTTELCNDNSHVPGVENFVTIISVTIFDDTEKTDGDLASVLSIGKDTDGDGVEDNTDAFPSDPTKWEKENESSGSSGGTFSYGILAILSLFGFRRKMKA